MSTYRGIVRGNVIELAGEERLPEGAEVEVVLKDGRGEGTVARVWPKGSARALLAVLDTPPRCTPEDVDALLQAIEQGKRPVRFRGVFDAGEAKR